MNVEFLDHWVERRLAVRTRLALRLLAGLNIGNLGLAALLQAAWPTALFYDPPCLALRIIGLSLLGGGLAAAVSAARHLLARGHSRRPYEATAASLLLIGSAAVPAGMGIALNL